MAKTRDGREIRGVRRNEDTFSLQMVDASGTLHLLDKLQLADVRVENTSLMPGDYGTRLAAGEIDDLVAYLSTLRERDLDDRVDEPRYRRRHLRSPGERGRRAAELVDVLGRFPGTHYSALKQITPRTSGSFRPPGRFRCPDLPMLEADAARRRRRDVHHGSPARWSRSTREPAVRSGDTRGRRRSGIRTRSIRSTAASRCSAIGCSSARSTPRWWRSTPEPDLPLWETQVADTMLGYSITSAPLVVKDKVIVGVTGGEFGARGFLDAYDAATGKQLWRWYAVPGPGEFGNDTWTGDSWKLGGSPMWLTGSYDPELNTLYWTVGNPGPQIDRSVRGDSTICSAIRSSRSIRTPASASGTISSRRTTATTGIRRRT